MRTTAVVGSVLVAGLLACAGGAPPQRLCTGSGTTAAWLEQRVEDGSDWEVVMQRDIALRSQTTVCRDDGSEAQGKLVWIGVDRRIEQDGVLQRREAVAEHGSHPRSDPKLSFELVPVGEFDVTFALRR